MANCCNRSGGGGGGGFKLRANSDPWIHAKCTLLSGSGIDLVEDLPNKTITIAAGLGASNKLFANQAGADSNDGNTESVIPGCQWNMNFDDAGANIQVRLSAFVKVSAGTGTYNIRVGGTKDAADGTVRATFTSVSAAYEQKTNLGSGFVNPGGQQIVKLCVVNSGGGNTSYISGTSVSIG